MPSNPKHGIGKAIVNEKKKSLTAYRKANSLANQGVTEAQKGKSVLEQNSLQEFMAQAELSHRTFEATKGQATFIEGPSIVSEKPELSDHAEAEQQALARRALVPIPRRPEWAPDTSKEELAALEGQSFVDWRRGLAELEERQNFVMTPFERNLDFWRQLWRCIERSDLLVQILDARDPEFYRSQDLERYVKEHEGKQHLLLINKSDFLSAELRRQWRDHFSAIGVDILFFSALHELEKQAKERGEEEEVDTAALAGQAAVAAAPAFAPKQRTNRYKTLLEDGEVLAEVAEDAEEDEKDAESDISSLEGAVKEEPTPKTEKKEKDDKFPAHGSFQDLEQDINVADVSALIHEIQRRLPVPDDDEARKPCVGFVGYPNVGKSSVINSIFGSKKVSMSRTPGKTKYLQTLELQNLGLTLCDCPGLVFPSVVATKAHLVINGVTPLTEIRDSRAPVKLILDKMGLQTLLSRYDCSEEHVRKGIKGHGEKTLDATRTFLSAFAVRRQHFLWLGVPDETWSAQRALRDFTRGTLLYCEKPSSVSAVEEKEAAAAAAAAAAVAPALEVEAAEGSDEDDFDDVQQFRGEEEADDATEVAGTKKLTKRAMRAMQKKVDKGLNPWSKTLGGITSREHVGGHN